MKEKRKEKKNKAQSTTPQDPSQCLTDKLQEKNNTK